MQTRNILQETFLRSTLILSIVFILASCQVGASPAANQTAPVSVSTTPELPPLAGIFQTDLLNPIDKPHVYVEETCRALKNKWNPLNAAPGTVVMIIMIKNITLGPTELPDSISAVDFIELMNQLRAQGFEAINTGQLQAFLERNILIPLRSVLLIQDGNQTAEYYDKHFREFFESWGWGVANGWVSEDEVNQALLTENVSLEYEGFVDHQARGVTADAALSDDTSKIIIARELQGSREEFANQFGKSPNSIVWPNGVFGIRPVEAARQLRFKLGFTANPRGPIMYNWVPLAAEIDPARPTLIPESRIDDPLMTLPAYPAHDALMQIDIVRAIGKLHADHAQANRQAEFNYYETVCEEEYGPMPSP